MTDTEEDIASPASKPQDETSRSCTKWTACKEACCPSCSTPITGNHHVRNFSQEMATTPPPKKFSKPPAPIDHNISLITAELQQACLDDDLEDIKLLLTYFDFHIKTSSDIVKYDISELTKSLTIARKLIEPGTNLPDPQTVSMEMPRVELTTVDWYSEEDMNQDQYDEEYVDWDPYDEQNVEWSSEQDINQDLYNEENVDWSYEQDRNQYDNSELFKTLKPDRKLIEPGTLPTPKSKTSNPASVAALGMGTFGIPPTRLLITPPPKETTESKPMPTKDSLSQPLLAGSAGKYPDPTNVESVETLNLATRVTEIQEVQIAEFSNTPIPNLNPEKDESIQHNLTPSRENGVTAPPDPTATHKDVIINPPVPTINLRKTSIISRFQEQFTMFDIKILSKPAVNLDADSYLGTTCPPLPSFLVQPDLKPPWNLYKREVY